MCGRYELHSHPAAIALTFGLAQPPELKPRYNIAPTTDVPVIRVNSEGVRELVHMRWGLVPRWSKDPSIGVKMINARGETIADKPSFKMAYRRHRCLLPANGFYEWMVLAATGGSPQRKQPVHAGMKDGALFGMAGLQERWRSPEGEVLDTCTIITTAANPVLKAVHDRMPLIIDPAQYARWLDPEIADVADLVVPYPATAMAYYAVSTKVNSVQHDDPSLLEAIASSPAAEIDATMPDAPPPHAPEQESLF